MRFRTATVAAACVALAATPAALGHSAVVATDPANGASVARLPATVTITFSGPLGRVDSVRVVRAGRDHVRSTRLDPRNARRVLVALRRGGPGRYTVTWRVRAADGHAQSGTFRFRVTGR